MPPQTILITGAGGFLGSHLSEYYLRQGFQVIGVDNFCTGLRSNWTELTSLPEARGHLQLIEADICDAWEKWLTPTPVNLTHIFHFASPASPPHYQRLSIETIWTNTLGLSHALKLADQHRARVVFASTSEIYGDPSLSPQPESYWGNVNSYGPRSCYDEAKRLGEAMIFSHNLRHGTEHGLVRIFNTYGPRMNPDDGRVIINFLTQAIRGKPLTVYGDGSQTRSFCYVSDLISGISKYAMSRFTEPFNLGNDAEFTILELIDAIQEIFPDRKLGIQHLRLPTDDPKRRKPDLTKARRLLDSWEPKKPLIQGLAQMRAWLEEPKE